MMRRYATVLAVAILALGLAAGCGKRDGGDGIATAGGAVPGGAATTAPTPGEFDQMGWIRCLREQGVPVDDPDPETGDKAFVHEEAVPKEKFDAAIEACRRYNPNWGMPPPPPDPAQIEQERRFAQCMRDNGVDMPDPGGSELPGGPTPGGPVFDRALAKCAEQVPGVVVPPSVGKKDK
jgi:hypothetical protein